VSKAKSANFGFLGGYDDRLLQSALAAERLVFEDSVAALMRLRQFGELLAQEAGALVGLYVGAQDTQRDLLRRLSDRGVLTREVEALFHDLRRKGNDAAHEGRGSGREALHQLRMARTLAVWFHRSLGNNPGFQAGAFVPPPNPADNNQLVIAELERLREDVVKAEAQAESLSATVEREVALRLAAERAKQLADQELEAALELAHETEAQALAAQAQWQARLAKHQAQAQAAPPAVVEAIVERAQTAGGPDQLDLDEAATRKLIDAQLQAVGWDADTEAINFKAGARPSKGRNLAIAEWPTASGPADYVLFAGLTPLAVVEAKRKRKDVAGAIEQAKRYSRDYIIRADERLEGGPWGKYKIPFLFATNGRGFLRQLETRSGIWFLDARRPTNHPGATDGWRSPEGLQQLLAQDHQAAEAKLEAEPTDYLGLREYQLDAIHAVERGIIQGKRDLLLAMATGTGKTRTALGLIYRLIKSGRFHRVLFLVDRSALGEQAEGVFKSVKLENLQSLHDIYDVMGLADAAPDPDTRLHIATIQGMVRRVLYGTEGSEQIPVDRYDCIIVDESHRGYNLDSDMGEGALEYRSQDDYVSKYRRVLDHFDAVRIGLTATPALHTSQIFGPPVYEYSYRKAVIDGYLVDHEPPIQILTKLNQAGIHWAAGEQVSVYRPRSGQVELFNTPDEINIDVDGFNTKVLTTSFNEVVCEQLARQIDPSLPGKVMIFCATDAHADTVVVALKAAFRAVYGEVEDDAVMKITGTVDRPLDKIRRYKNETFPKVAVTVDLLTTGIDVPQITSLVFIRRVKSRILYEQMIGRATRLCPEIDKQAFRIYDAVDLYAALADFSTMKPVATRPQFSFAQLAEEIATIADHAHCETVIDELLVKLHRRKNRLEGDALASFELLAGSSPSDFIALLRRRQLDEVREFFAAHPRVPELLDNLPAPARRGPLISEHPDEFIALERGYGNHGKPEDYLEGFGRYLREHGNQLPALMVVTQRPRELTRQQLKELSLALDAAGFNATGLRTAWAETTNQDIAAGIIGFIRQRALGTPLVPYEERVDRAHKAVLATRAWTPPQRDWLARIVSQIKRETIVDKAALDRGQFQAHGGFKRLDKVFEGELEHLLGELHEQVWA